MKTYAEARAERQAHAAKLIAELTSHFGADFTELIATLEKADDQLAALIQKNVDVQNTKGVSNEEVEASDDATLSLLHFVTDGFSGRAGFHGGSATISFGISPSTIYHSLQSAEQLGLAEAIRQHREGCGDPTCSAPNRLESFLGGLHHLMAHARDAMQAEVVPNIPNHMKH